MTSFLEMGVGYRYIGAVEKRVTLSGLERKKHDHTNWRLQPLGGDTNDVSVLLIVTHAWSRAVRAQRDPILPL